MTQNNVHGLSSTGPAVNAERIADVILTDSAVDGGATVDRHGRRLSARDGYMVSLAGRELTLAPLATPTARRAEIVRYVEENARLLCSRPDYYVGAWVDGGNLVLDISRHIACQPDALAFGFDNGQRAIYDVLNDEVIFTRIRP